jgi:uncharacterized protein (DUF697 family)
MDDADEKYFELLLTEKQLADSMVGGYADLSLKVFGMFGVGGVLISWLFSKDAAGRWSVAVAVACIALAVASCGIVVQGIATYCLTLGYIQYRNEYLNDEFRVLLKRAELPIQAVRRWSFGAARKPTTLAHTFIGILHGSCCVALLLVAAYNLWPTVWALVALVAAWIVLLATALVQHSLYQAMKRVFLAA